MWFPVCRGCGRTGLTPGFAIMLPCQEVNAMKRTIVFAVVLSVATLGTGWAFAQATGERIQPYKQRDLGGLGKQVTATVKSVDKENRTVVLVGEEGTELELPVGEEVRNFEQIDVGDTVVVDYQERLAVALYATSEAGPKGRIVTTEVSRADPGSKPYGAVTRTVEIAARVVELDPEARTATLEGKDATVKLRVSEDVDLSKVKVGDTVVAKYLESTAIAVEEK